MLELGTWTTRTADEILDNNNVCGCFLGDGCEYTSVKAYAMKPINGNAAGQRNSNVEYGNGDRTVESGRISAAWCLEQCMQNFPQSSKKFVGMSRWNGHCYCFGVGGSCTSVDAYAEDRLYELVRPDCGVAHSTDGIADGTNCTCSTGYKGSITWDGDTASGTCSPGKLKKRSFTHATLTRKLTHRM